MHYANLIKIYVCYNYRMKRRIFTPEQKTSIVLELLSHKKTPSQICSEHGIAYSLLVTWKDSFLRNAHKAFGKQEESLELEKIKKLEYVISKLTTQNDFLDKVLLQIK